jgi:hypothetical protein
VEISGNYRGRVRKGLWYECNKKGDDEDSNINFEDKFHLFDIMKIQYPYHSKLLMYKNITFYNKIFIVKSVLKLVGLF